MSDEAVLLVAKIKRENCGDICQRVNQRLLGVMFGMVVLQLLLGVPAYGVRAAWIGFLAPFLTPAFLLMHTLEGNRKWFSAWADFQIPGRYGGVWGNTLTEDLSLCLSAQKPFKKTFLHKNNLLWKMEIKWILS